MKVAICDCGEGDIAMVWRKVYVCAERMHIHIDCDVFSECEELIKNIECNIKYEIYFVGTQLGNVSGIEIAKRIRRKDCHAIIIFLTNKGEDVSRFFEVHAFNFVMKPFDIEMLERAISDVFMHVLSDDLRIGIRSDRNTFFIKKRDIVYIESSGHILNIYRDDGKVISYYGKLSDVTRILDERIFIRINRSDVINIFFVESFNSREIIMSGGVRLPFGNTYKGYFKSMVRELEILDSLRFKWIQNPCK